MRAIVGPLVELLAAVPSIIYGFWGLVVLVPFIDKLEPGLHSALGFIPLFGPASPIGISVFTAGLVLTVMILPIISALSRDLFLTVPTELKDGAAALGATQWEVIRGIVLPTTVSGVSAAVVLGLGRALGEAIAVSFVIGDVTRIHKSLFEPASTIGAEIANQFTSPVNALHTASMFYAGLVLVVIGMLTSVAARTIAGRFDVTPEGHLSATSETALFEGMPFDPTAPLTPSGNLRRRAAVSRFVQITATAAAVFAVAVLVIVLYGVASPRRVGARASASCSRTPPGWPAAGSSTLCSARSRSWPSGR